MLLHSALPTLRPERTLAVGVRVLKDILQRSAHTKCQHGFDIRKSLYQGCALKTGNQALVQRTVAHLLQLGVALAVLQA